MAKQVNGRDAAVGKRVVYLAGGTVTNWRDQVVKALAPEYECIDPIKHSRQGAIMEFTADDLAAIDRCDLVLGVCDYPQQHGVALEFGYAYARGKPIVYAALTERVESMMVGVSKVAFTDVAAAVEYIKKRGL